MTDGPLFSIVTITKDNPVGFAKTQNSIAAQSCRDFEWIVINGGYPVTNCAPDILIEEADSGIYDAMNKGLDIAHGQYIVFMNAGDAFSDPDILSAVRRAVEHDNPDILYGDALEEGFIYKKARPHAKIDKGMITHHQSIYYRRDSLGALRYDSAYRIAGDYAFTRKALKNAKIVHYIPAALCLFADGGASQRNRGQGRREEFLIRHRDGVPVFHNYMVYLRQIVAAFIRTLSPRLYRTLRRV